MLWLPAVPPRPRIQLLEQAGASVEAICVLLELEGLGGRNVIDQSIFEPIVVIED